MDHHQQHDQDRRRREPLWVTPLQTTTTTTTIPSNNNNSHHQYRQLERIVTPLHHHGDNDNGGGEVETILEALYETNHENNHEKLLWRRVVVQSSTSNHNNQKMVHASFLLPQVDDNDTDDDTDNDDTLLGSRLAWTTFAEQNDTEATPETSKSQPVLCVLAAPTLLCLYHVHPSNNRKSNTVVVEDAHTIPLPFRAARLQALTSGLLLQRQASVVDQEELQMMMQSQYPSFLNSHNSKEEPMMDDNDNDGFVLQAPPKPVRTTTPMNHSMTTNVNHGVPSLFSLQHPLEDVLPVLWLNHDNHDNNPSTTTTERMVTDVFETVLFCGSFEWEDETNDHDQQQLPICVTYHQHLKRYVRYSHYLIEFIYCLKYVCSQLTSPHSLFCFCFMFI